jgi:hypothetical protein
MLAAAISACVISGAAAQERKHLVAELDGDSFVETYSPEVSVSGAVIVGVASSKALAGSVTRSLSVVSRPDISERTICLTMVSRDGAYYSRSVFTMDRPENSGGQPVWLPYDRSRKGDILEGYDAPDIAMLATPGDCKSATTNYYIVDSREPTEPEFVRIYVNSFGATDVYYRNGEAGEPEACTFIDTGQRTSFDYWCELDWEAVDAAPQVEILRERFGRELPTVHLNVLTAPQL